MDDDANKGGNKDALIYVYVRYLHAIYEERKITFHCL